MITAGVVGGSGYLGGELLRLLLGHPEVRVAAVVSTRLPGRRVDSTHPNLRGVTDLTFCREEALPELDVLLLAAPHRETMRILPRLAERAKVVIDLSGDFRLADPAVYERYYGVPHELPDLLGGFVPGYPELFRDALRAADRISVPGCMASAAVLALTPLTEAGLVEPDVEVDARTGSSGSGATAGPQNLHAERSGAMRIFATGGHRHEPEIAALCGVRPRLTATGVEAVRGVQVICRTALTRDVTEAEVRALYQNRYDREPFVRVVAHRRGLYRLPEPKILLGSNFCDVGFALDRDGGRLLAVAALDNLVKGGAGAAVQSMNVRMGLPERSGLGFPGLHPL
ncbi:N-acetyl-gamma-glutamyl-phosphate reductase [Phytohabitans aurantiacus]|jgi:N-acetyl-gamma-glutamyl-phosphate/LysW-gamma-L-alpha-aminoadipyl-6-phosphate reductase|uniref:N-acetyl-gamma-glutamyl-phosphate reductase n=1 Tax=Phytohabitans aurantiacus TaxID=3016789 RepID=A0ABQ5R774_9ACTN|nr:N-acetyl-gamma-glutamyl-phosphate reductase [Phytohabitans aurantiacus]GLI02611.1 N-acetyl-gamma-glutamyl-phosphate/N-acetyl-gamma- aminoadipyl-phosphate reductase [Phytohabitans aurantiacus]